MATVTTDMGVSCWSLIPYLWQKLLAIAGLYSKVDVPSLPDAVIIDILSRLPADHVLQCRRVCKEWRALTSTACFAQLQLKRATSEILIGVLDSDLPRCVSVNHQDFSQKIAELNCWVLNSCDGLILGKRKIPSQVFIYNPLTQDEITFPEVFNECHIYGIYFHPVKKEYRVLYAFGHDQANYYQYSIANLPTFSRRPLSHRFYCCPPSAEATIASGNLHWMLEHRKDSSGNPVASSKMEKDDEPCANSILKFDIHTENFSTMPHPEWESCTGPSYGEMQLLQVDERLSVCHKRGYSVFLWTLVDYPNWHWIRRYKVNLRLDMQIPNSVRNSKVTFLWLKHDELVLHCQGESKFLVYNFKMLAYREIELSKNFDYTFYSHKKSLVSVRKQ
ncbi:hypothetical protein Tsubulata_003042 [Turnera subulata]|uniref:F-box domain-containing protein n=1 Tax=Turnera subulata TaxID=218843 RepID=A0A9Q0JHB8_9ROSI|nr:hypothetical protein Tsubulata_003042 [Turnera subulata]